jgi:hypothetical protein
MVSPFQAAVGAACVSDFQVGHRQSTSSLGAQYPGAREI